MTTIIGVLTLVVLFAGVCMLVGKPKNESGWLDNDKDI